MKPTATGLSILSSLVLALPSLAASAPELSAVPQDIGPHSRLWVFQDKDASGQLKPSTGHTPILELETGRAYWDGKTWQPSDPTFRVTETAFIADRVHAASRLNAEINVVGAVQIAINGITLRSTPLAVALYDPKSGSLAIIASLTNSTGVLVGDSQGQVLYENALVGPGASCDVLYRIDRANFHQDVIFRCKPNLQGFPTNSLIQIISEFYDAPEPDRIRQPVDTDRVDETLGWDEFVFGQGHAYTTPTDSKPEGTFAIVSKEYKTVTTTNGIRKLLIESVPVSDLQFASLPDCSAGSQQGNFKRFPDPASGYASLRTPPQLAQAASTTRQPTVKLAQANLRGQPGVWIDWVATVGAGLYSSPFIFSADTNYCIVSANTMNSSVVLEGGAVIKYKTDASLTFNSTVTAKGESYRMTIMTAVDDDSVGESFNGLAGSGYTGTINTNGYANPAISIGSSSMTLKNVRFCYAKTAIKSDRKGLTLTASHSQFVQCIRGVDLTTTSGCAATVVVNGNNLLMAAVRYPFSANYAVVPITMNLAHCTIDNCTRLADGQNNNNNASLQATNCIIAAATSFNIPSGGAVTVGGYNNAFYGCSSGTFGLQTIQPSLNPFQTAGACQYYLNDPGGLLRNGAVTTGLPSSLMSDLKKRTTYPPLIISNATVSTDFVLRPQALRDTDAPDMGYHADAADYLVSGLTVSGATLTLNPGTAILTFGDAGITLADGAALNSSGAPTARNHITRYKMVQEQPINYGGGSVTNFTNVVLSTSSSAPTLTCRFTDFETFASGGYHIYTDTTTHRLAALSLKDCALYSGQAVFSGSISTTLSLTNNLFERVYSQFNGYPTLWFYNNLVELGRLSFSRQATAGTWTAKDNSFDNYQLLADSGNLTHDYNAYIAPSTPPRLSPNAPNDTIRTNFIYSAGTLGPYYQSSSPLPEDPTRTAANAGLYHHTTRTTIVDGKQVKEGTSNVDLGLHYVATDASGIPLDGDLDGVPDAIEDYNGNNIVEGTETDWQVYNSPNGLTTGNGLQVFTPLK